MVESAEQVVGFVGDGGDDPGVGGGGVKIDKGVIGFVLVVGVDGFSESGKSTVGVKGGGFADEEIALAQENGITPITLGKRILRTETAGMTTTAILLYELD